MSATPGEPARIAVIGLGNVLFGDDGFGPQVIALLRAGWEFPPEVELIDAGTPGLGLVTYLYGREAAILIDAVAATGDPGELRLYRGDDLRRIPPQPRVSPHDPAVQETLGIAELSGHGPRSVLLVGAIPASSTVGIGLSEAMGAAAAASTAVVIGELARIGAVALPRACRK